MSNSLDHAQCVHCNATQGQYQPDYGWHLCGTCYEDIRQDEIESVIEEFKNTNSNGVNNG